MDVSVDELRQAVERLHHCKAVFREVVPVTERFQDQLVWEGGVHVFDLTGHPTAATCYAWSAAVDGSDRRRFYAVLKAHPVSTPHEAVRASIVSDFRVKNG